MRRGFAGVKWVAHAHVKEHSSLLLAADARQHDRDTQLAQTLAALAEQKRAVATPAQIPRALPKTLPLPEPITLQADGAFRAGTRLASPPATPWQSNQNQPDGAFITRADLKPLYDFTLDCQACQAKLSAAQSDLADERSRTTALTKERNDALRIAKGGSPSWRRVTRAAKWFLLGAAAGAAVAKTR